MPDIVQRKRSAKCKRITDGHGSATLSKLLEARTAQRMAAEAATQLKANAAQERAQKKAEASNAALAQLELWRACQGGCMCTGGAAVCVVKGLVLCPYCDTLKRGRKCGAAACKEKAAMEAAEATRGAEDEGAGEEGEADVDEDGVVRERERERERERRLLNGT